MDKIKLVCFDVDGTLVEEAGGLFLGLGASWFLLTKGLGCSPKKHSDIFRRAQKGEISFVEGERMLVKMYRNSGNATKAFIKKLFANVRPRSEAKNLISYLKKKGHWVYLISGAIDIYVNEIARKIGVNGFYANSTLEFDEKGILKKIHYRDNQGELKVEQLNELIQKLGVSMNEVAFIGDSENDIEVFEKTKHGIAVHCFNKDLEKVAWKTVDSLKQIKKIL